MKEAQKSASGAPRVFAESEDAPSWTDTLGVVQWMFWKVTQALNHLNFHRSECRIALEHFRSWWPCSFCPTEAGSGLASLPRIQGGTVLCHLSSLMGKKRYWVLVWPPFSCYKDLRDDLRTPNTHELNLEVLHCFWSKNAFCKILFPEHLS